ncbi:RNA polymerase sigma factor [Chitinophaga defluvii]|uniref:RNA polymerase sigma-70 factor n=1 Tax=Chitinophaga defluvii TaxID=3163343 RepID=A0ABV2T7S8_9BACT
MNYKQSSDIELWQRCQQDDMRAYNALFDRYFPKLYSLSLRYVKDSSTAEELAMDVLCNLWYKRNELTIRTDISTYFFRSMKNHIINQLKKNIPVTSTLELVGEHQLVSDSQADNEVLISDLETIYREQLDQLSPQRRRVFQLSREEHLTYAEIAREMNISVSAVEKYMGAALSSLRNGMKDYSLPSLLFLFGSLSVLVYFY